MDLRRESEATYCSEFERFVTSTDKRITPLRLRRPQRLSQKHLADAKPRIMKCSQEIFSSQDIRDAQDSSNLTCKQQNIEDSNTFGVENVSVPLTLSNKLKVFKNEIFSEEQNLDRTKFVKGTAQVSFSSDLRLNNFLKAKSQNINDQTTNGNTKQQLLPSGDNVMTSKLSVQDLLPKPDNTKQTNDSNLNIEETKQNLLNQIISNTKKAGNQKLPTKKQTRKRGQKKSIDSKNNLKNNKFCDNSSLNFLKTSNNRNKSEISDSDATYCSEFEVLVKTKTNSHLPTISSQRLSRKPLANALPSWNYSLTNPSVKFMRTSHIEKSTQEVFSTQDLREVQDSSLTHLTCQQQHIEDLNYLHSESLIVPLTLSNKFKVFKNEIYSQDQNLEKSRNLPVENPKYDQVVDLSIKSELKESRSADLKQKDAFKNKSQNINNQISNENTEQQLTYSCGNVDSIIYKVSTQDSLHKSENTKLINDSNLTVDETKPNSLTEISSNTKKAKKRKSPPKKQTRKKRQKKTIVEQASSVQNTFPFKISKPNMNYMQTSNIQNELIKIKNISTSENRLTKSILPDVCSIHFKYQNSLANMNDTPSTQDRLILPDVYPPHFKYQLPPEAVLTRPLVLQPTIMTPDDTPSCELQNSTSTSPSLPESLRGIFDTDDIKDILNIERVAYRLYDYHVQALAVVLNLRLEYLREILDKIIKVNSNVMRNVDKAMKTPFVIDMDLFATTPEEMASDDEVVFNSQSPNKRVFTLTKSNLTEQNDKF